MRTIPFSPPDLTQLEIDAVTEVLQSGWITTGKKTKQFEREIADYCGTPRAVCLNSASAAMELTLRLLGIGPGDEVITSAYTYTASASVIHHVGAKIVLCDIKDGGFEMDYDKLESLISPNTKVIIPVDIAGVICDYDRIFRMVEAKRGMFRPSSPLQEQYGRVVVMADAAHSFGSVQDGRMAGSFADFSCFSFHAVKNLTTGEGGTVTWRAQPFLDDAELYKRFMLLSLHGQDKDALAKTAPGSWEYDIVSPDFKCNMTDIMGALGLAQLQRYPEILKKRRAVTETYDVLLTGDVFIRPRLSGPSFQSNSHLYLLRLAGYDTARRNALIAAMAQKGIACNVHYKPLPMMTAYQKLGFDIADYPVAYQTYVNEITLPVHGQMTGDDAAYTAQELKNLVSTL